MKNCTLPAHSGQKPRTCVHFHWAVITATSITTAAVGGGGAGHEASDGGSGGTEEVTQERIGNAPGRVDLRGTARQGGGVRARQNEGEGEREKERKRERERET